MNITKAKPNLYRTSDLSLAAALSVCGFVITDTESIGAKRMQFVFSHSKGLEETVTQYWQGKLRVNPQHYFNELKSLKSRIYQSR